MRKVLRPFSGSSNLQMFTRGIGVRKCQHALHYRRIDFFEEPVYYTNFI